MNMQRRDFLERTLCLSAGAVMTGCAGSKLGFGGGTGSLANFAVAPMERIRVGFIGLGERGTWAVHRICHFPIIETAALCDLRTEQAEKNRTWLKDRGKAGAMKLYAGKDDSWKGVCDDPDVDVVYICTPAQLHCEMELYALRAGKHVMIEVPAAQTIDQAWEIVETSEKVRRHCMMLENACYCENEMLCWNLAHLGLLGTLTHAEGGYIHNLVWRHLENDFRNRALFGGGKTVHRYGNTYPTHPLGPICMYMDMNRGDRMTSVSSFSSLAAACREQAAHDFPKDAWQNTTRWETGDMNTSIIRTAKGRTIMLQIDMETPRPYSRLGLLQGTKGCFYDFPLRIALAKRPGGDNHNHNEHNAWVDEKRLAEIKAEYRHPLWKSAGDVALKVGGHGGCDFMMDLRWIYCLKHGLPLDMDVYDLAAWSAVLPCSAESDREGGIPVEIPDFTRGAWKTAKPLTIGAVDLKEMGYDVKAAEKDVAQMNV